MADDAMDQVKRNYAAFVVLLPSLLRTHAGKFALMRDGKVIEFFDTARDAHVAGSLVCAPSMLFSIQEVTQAPLGISPLVHDPNSDLRQPQGPTTGINAIIGRWPGDETDEQLSVLLRELS